MGESLRLSLALRGGARGEALVGAGPQGLAFRSAEPADDGRVLATSTRPIARKIQKLALDILWSREGGTPLPGRTSNLVYVTMGRPMADRQETWPEDGVTVKRMDAAVSLVSAMQTLDPHEIMHGLMALFPYYTLQSSPKVPRKYGHPAYFNKQGGAWAMADYVEETGECQAIARFLRAVLRQLGVPGDLTILLVWADPRVGGGRKEIEVDWEKEPTGGLDASTRIDGRRAVAALVDGPVEEGKTYPPSHTRMRGGRVSPGLNRYEAFIRFSYGGETLYYAPGAGVYREGEPRLRVFWGLVWVSAADDEGFRVEKIVARYR
jgi:hypothetical protein